MRATWLLGSTGSILMAGGAIAAPFEFGLAVSNEAPLPPGGLNFEGALQVIAGNGGVMATNSFADGDVYIFSHIEGVTTAITGADGGYFNFQGLAISPNAGNKLSFIANIGDNDFALYQSPITGGGLTRLDVGGVNPTNTAFENVHYQVNASGVAVFKHLNNGFQSFSTGGGPTSITVTEGDDYGVKNFNQAAGIVTYRRQAITSNGSVVFYAEHAVSNVSGIYRIDSGGTLNDLNLSGISQKSRVVGASDDAVLFTTHTGPGPIQTANLTLQVGPTGPIVLASYAEDAGSSRPINAVMTQQNRVAYFDPGPGDSLVSANYYSQGTGDVTIISEGQSITQEGSTFFVKQISAEDTRTTNPMVNDNGIVVFDAVLNPEIAGDVDEDTDLKALLMWDEVTGETKIVVKVGDAFGAGVVTDLFVDTFNDTAGDVLKDGLSEDNWLGFSLTYSDDNDNAFVGVGTVHVPEPASAASLALIGTGALLRRRRTR